MSRRFEKIDLRQFQLFLSQWIYEEFSAQAYGFDWRREDNRWARVSTEIKERCFLIPLNEHALVKIYSTIDKLTGVSRERGRDSIKLVLAKPRDLKPIRPKFTHVYRLNTWPGNFRQHLREVLESYLGRDLKCRRTKCGGELILKKTKRGTNFIGCSNYQTNGCREAINL